MRQSKIKTIEIFSKKKNKKAIALAHELTEWFQHRNVKTLSGQKRNIVKKADLLIVLGGDGTLLSVVRHLIKPTPILGINLGDLGFITELNIEEIYPVLKTVLKGNYAVDNRIMLNAHILNTTQKKEKSFQVLNEVVIHNRSESRLIELDLLIDEKGITSIKGDGLIVATPTGSTAYSLAAGGPIIHPKTNSIAITPICPHGLTNRPLIIPNTSEIMIRIPKKRQKVILALDGQKFYPLRASQSVLIQKASLYTSLIKYPSRNYYDILKTKLHLGLRGNNGEALKS
ncbi:MAG: NAD(+)/NADH kinase [Deltaproteobacteria bacterium]|nr:NAD(+)/NADH kinase [Deltaproteobacteria bacterium]